MEFELKNFPGFTSLQILAEIQKMMNEMQCEPERFTGRIILMSMYNDIVWRDKENKELRIANSINVAGHVHTLTCCTHIFLLYIHCAHTSHILDACHIHAWLKGQGVLPNLPDLKAQVKRTPHEDEEFGYLADSAHSTGYEPIRLDHFCRQ